MITIGEEKAIAVYLGNKPVAAIYVGDSRVWPDASLSLSADQLSFAEGGEALELGITVEPDQEWTLSVPAPWAASATSGTGSATVTLTIGNNTSTSPHSGSLVVSSDSLEQACSLSQAAGVQVYGEVGISAFSYADIPAGGGSATPTLGYSQPWTWNGVAGSGGTITSGASVTYSGAGVDTATGAVSATSKGTTLSDRTTVAEATATVSLNGKTATTSTTVYQGANSASYETPSVSLGSYPDIPASGGSVSPRSYSYAQEVSYTSGSSERLTSGGSLSFRRVWGSVGSVNSSNGVITGISSLGTNLISRTNLLDVRLTVTMNGVSGESSSVYVYQAANTRWSTGTSGGVYTYSDVSAGTITNKTIPASGGAATATAGDGSQSWTRTAIVTTYRYDSGATSSETTSPDTSGSSVILPSSRSFSSSAGSKRTTISPITIVVSRSVTWSGNGGKSASGTMYIYQEANSALNASNVKIVSCVYPEIPADGGTSTPEVTVSYQAEFTSGATGTASGIPEGATCNFLAASPLPSGFSLSSPTLGTVTATANTTSAVRKGEVMALIMSEGRLLANLKTKVTQAASSKIMVTLVIYRNSVENNAFVSRPLHAEGLGAGIFSINGRASFEVSFDRAGRSRAIVHEFKPGDKVRAILPKFTDGYGTTWKEAQTADYTIAGNETKLIFVPMYITDTVGDHITSGDISLEKIHNITPSPIGVPVFEKWPLDDYSDSHGSPLGIVAQGPGSTGTFVGVVRSYLPGQIVYAVLPPGYDYMGGRPYYGISPTFEYYDLMEQPEIIYPTDGTIVK